MPALTRLSDWWFPELEPRRLALLRIGWAVCMAVALVPSALDASWLFGGPWVIGGALVAVAAYGAGLATRVTGPLAWVLFQVLHAQNPDWSTGGDSVLRVFGAYTVLMPTEAVWSVDARLGWTRPLTRRTWLLRLFQLNLCLLYVKTGLVKLPNPLWQQGLAVHYSLALQGHQRIPLDALLGSAAVVSKVLTWSTLVFEVGFPLVWWRRARVPVLIAGLALHLSIGALMDVGVFSVAMIWTYVAFVPLPDPKSLT